MKFDAFKKISNLPLNSKLIGFSPFLDDKKIMRVGGRLAFSDLAQEQKNPIILAKDHFFTSDGSSGLS